MSDSDQKLRDRQADLILVIEAIDEVLKSKAWQTLKELVLDGLVSRVERLLLSESKGVEVNTANIYRLQGELNWAKRYGDLKSYAEMLKQELQGIKDNLK